MHDGDFTTISDAVQCVQPGTIILVRPGIYEESVTMYEPLAVIGDGSQHSIIINGNLSVRGQGQTLVKGLSIHCPSKTFDPHYQHALLILDGKVTVEDCDISGGNDFTVYAVGAIIQRCRVHEGRQAVYLMNSSMIDCEVFNNSWGIELQKGASIIRQCRIHNNASGISASISGPLPATIEDCQISGHRHSGIDIYGGDVHVDRCQIRGNNIGIQVSAPARASISNSDLTGNSAGSFFIKNGAHVNRVGNQEETPSLMKAVLARFSDSG